MKQLYLAILLATVSCLDIVKRYPHDSSCYTQGFEFINNSILIESCGLYKFSRVQYISALDDDNMKSIATRKLHDNVFAEGTTKFGDNIYVLTWRQNKVYVYTDKFTLQKIIRWQNDGWGLSHNQTHMFVTDGSAYVYIVKEDFKIIDKILVTKKAEPVHYLNELEYYKGRLLANVYMQKRIVEIDLSTGEVVNQYDTSQLYEEEKTKKPLRQDEVVNGIAYDEKADRLLLTGKKWSQIYEVKL